VRSLAPTHGRRDGVDATPRHLYTIDGAARESTRLTTVPRRASPKKPVQDDADVLVWLLKRPSSRRRRKNSLSKRSKKLMRDECDSRSKSTSDVKEKP
jgi:hypothetical protein